MSEGEPTPRGSSFERAYFQRGVRFALAFVFLLWLIKSIEVAVSGNFAFLGVYPRTLSGSIGILTGPLIHSDWLHLASNSIPLVILTIALFYFFSRIAIPVFSLIYLITGFWVWIAARQAFHIGASGVVYGLIAFVMFSGFIRKDIKLMALSFATMVLYGSQMVYGVLPVAEGVSWESHLLGVFAGIFLAIYFRPSAKKKALEHAIEREPKEATTSYFTYVHREPFDYTIGSKTKPEEKAKGSKKFEYQIRRPGSNNR